MNDKYKTENIMEKIYKFAHSLSLSTKSLPKPYDWFHFIWLVLLLGGVALVFFFSLKDDKKTLYISYIVSASVMWVGELVKQFLSIYDSSPVGVYRWYDFPFQFCSTPLYTFLLAAILKKGKIYDYLSAYNSTYCLFAGLIVMLTPSTVFSHSMTINFQSMIHHILMITTAVAGLRVYAKKFDLSLYRGAFIVFMIGIVIAEILNFTIPPLTGQDVNMFFIGPYMDNVKYITPFKKAFPYPIFVGLYILVFSEVAAGIAYGAYRLAYKKKKFY